MKKNQKIVHFHTNGKFASLFVAPLILAERSRGYDSTIITSEHLSSVGGRIIPCDLRLRNLPGVFLTLARICNFLAKQEPTLVVSHNTKSSPLPLLAACLMGVKNRIYFNHGVPFVGYRGFLRVMLKALELINCSLATEVVTVSTDMRNLLLSVKSSAKVTLIHNGSACGIDLDTYRASRYVVSPFRIDHGIAEDDVVVVFIGRPERRKGFEIAVRLWRDYFSGPGYKLVLCGADKSDVLKVVPEVPANVICMGFAKNIPEILSNSDCLILPSLHEGLSYAVLEAMACGCLVVANDIEGIHSIVKNGQNGYLIGGNSILGYEKLIRSLKEPVAELSAVKRRALETAGEYSRKDFLPAYLSFVERKLGCDE